MTGIPRPEQPGRLAWVALGIVMMALAAASCGSSTAPTAEANTGDAVTGDSVTGDSVTGDTCIVRLHGKGGSGQPTVLTDAGIVVVSPEGPDDGWDGRQWRYDEPESYRRAVEVVAEAITAAECQRVAFHGFSNGGAMAIELHCSGQGFDAEVVGYVIDDPVPDAAADSCRPTDGVEAVLYWTGALDEVAPAGTTCASVDWTCAGLVVRPIDDVAADLGVPVRASVNDEHEWYEDPPELTSWLG